MACPTRQLCIYMYMYIGWFNECAVHYETLSHRQAHVGSIIREWLGKLANESNGLANDSLVLIAYA